MVFSHSKRHFQFFLTFWFVLDQNLSITTGSAWFRANKSTRMCQKCKWKRSSNSSVDKKIKAHGNSNPSIFIRDKQRGRESANAVIICFAHYCIYYGTVARENEYFSRAIYVRIGSFQNDQRKVSLISEILIPIFTQFTMQHTTLKWPVLVRDLRSGSKKGPCSKIGR